MALQREQVVQTAEKYVSRGKIEPAIREYRKLLAENPNDINTLNRVGDLYARIQRIEEAVDFFNQIGQQYADQGFFVKAIAIYKKIIKLDPTRLEVYERLADLYHRQNLVTEARTQYQVLADYYTKHDNAASAIAIYNKMVDLEPENPSYHVKLAEIYHQQKLFEKAVNEYRIIAEMMIRHGRSQEAAQVYERALAIDSKNLRFIRSALEALRDAGAEAAASHFLTVAIERNPDAQELASVLEKREEPAAPEPEPEPEPVYGSVASIPRTPTFEEPELDDASIELEIDLGDDLMAAMREAEAAVSGSSSPAMKAAAPAVDDEVDIEFDLDPMEELVELPDDAPASQVKPPPDLAGAPVRPAWARSEPAAAAPEPAEPAEPAEDTGEIEIEIDLEIEAEPSFGQSEEEPALPEITAFEGSGDAFVLEDEIEVEAMPAWEVEETAAPAGPSREELERDELITEAEVLAKYGLEEKALERLAEALRVRPDSLTAHALLIRIHLDKNRHDKVLELARVMSGIATAARVAEPWESVRQRLVESGYRLEGNEVLSGPFVPAPPLPSLPSLPPASAPAPPIEEIEPIEEIQEIEEIQAVQEIQAVPPTPPPVAAAPASAPPAARPTRREVDEMMRGILGPQTPARKPVAPPPAASVPQAPPVAPAPAPAPVASAPTPPPAAPAGGLFDLTSLGEMIEAEELGDAPALSLPAFPVSPPPAKSEADQLWDAAKPGLAPKSSPSVAPSVAPFSGGLEDSGVGWLDEAEANKGKAAAPGGSALFDDEEDFFDLAGELVEELSREEVFQDGVMVQQEQSLEEIVEGFKKGVAEHLSPTDYDTHYNLGIAYREMGLLDEAIGEFQLAAKDGRYLVICCSMLGLCFLDKGIPELAIKWYRRGLEVATLSEDDQLGLMYDMGNAFLAMGDNATAYGTFVEIYGINTNYRDVVAKLEELRR